MEYYLSSFITLFSVVDPIGVAWLFAAMTRGATPQEQRRMAINATLLASIILLVFFFSRTILLDWIGITIPAFRIAGGILRSEERRVGKECRLSCRFRGSLDH